MNVKNTLRQLTNMLCVSETKDAGRIGAPPEERDQRLGHFSPGAPECLYSGFPVNRAFGSRQFDTPETKWATDPPSGCSLEERFVGSLEGTFAVFGTSVEPREVETGGIKAFSGNKD